MKETTKRNDVLKNEKIEFQAYGVSISIESEKSVYLEATAQQLKKVFPHGLEKMGSKKAEYRFRIGRAENSVYELYLNDKKIDEISNKKFFFEALESQIRMTIAEFARSRVFLHAGVIGWKGKAIVIPARSFSGKTTLVAELVKKGATYYSDEYAVLDAGANVQPFPKWLSLRSRAAPYTQKDRPVESLGGVAGTEIIPVGMVLIARFARTKKMPLRWNPKRLTRGQGMMEILQHAIPIRNQPEFVLEVLNKLTARAIIVKTIRGEAKEFADTLLNYFENQMR